ncbi:hypothetical protein BIV60_24275 [Bacillus sp. MUM 116]|uniref:hypothetical protein n=1 Tax=Bacillus sp. MUM 116 TaxID=1678002 RepID=UPI0008F5D2F4|nr:hypothetical protein [Bacillus sp. MUM 116]OIK09350.1 hypothetical protein BIV60_24275 [Bacillus sp. MUM 116]
MNEKHHKLRQTLLGESHYENFNLADYLSDKQKQRMEQMGKRNKPLSKEDKQEKVNWKVIMGMNRDTYTGRMGQLQGFKFKD